MFDDLAALGDYLDAAAGEATRLTDRTEADR